MERNIRTEIMSYNVHSNYNYCPPAPSYYVEDQDGCLGDYSDNEGYSDNQHSFPSATMQGQNLPESYAIHPQVTSLQAIPMERRFHRSQPYIPQCYYENPLTQLQRTHTVIPLKSNVQHYPFHSHQHCPIEEDPNYQGYPTYRNSYPNNTVQRQQQYNRNVHKTTLAQEMVQNQNVKRYPIKVGTPKYYRRPPTNTLYRRPSALCLPVLSQPDPAVNKRPKKMTGYNRNYNRRQDINNTPEGPKPEVKRVIGNAEFVAHKMDSEGDVNAKLSNFEAMLEKFETETVTPKVKRKNDIAKISKYLKPKVPASVKLKQQQLNTKFDADSDKEYKFEVPEVSADSLEKLLDQLKKCETPMGTGEDSEAERNDVHEERSREMNRDLDVNGGRCIVKNDSTDDETRPQLKSFNYRDIVQQMFRTQDELKSHASTSSIQDLTRRLTSSVSDGTQPKPRSCAPKPILDDHCALELHRSKSYIVDLIDKALSKELGTVPGERSRRKFDNMNPKKAVDLMNRHVGQSEKDFSVKITNTLTDSIISHATAPEDLPSPSSKTKLCVCNSEEPIYIKQLKQLRWGHLKHIQREVRRLEDLERFLDSCSITTIPEI